REVIAHDASLAERMVGSVGFRSCSVTFPVPEAGEQGDSPTRGGVRPIPGAAAPPEDTAMTLEPAQRAGDAPRIGPERGTSPDPPRSPPAAESGHPTRLPVPPRPARIRAERERWMRRRRLERQLHDGAALRISAL